MSQAIQTIDSAGAAINLAAGYTSIRATDLETRKKVYAAVTNPLSLKDNLGKNLAITDVLAQPVSELDEKTGEVDTYTRVILLAADGKAYSASSTGIVNSIETAFRIFGEPADWPEGGLTFTAREVQSPNNKAWRFVTLDVV